MSKSDIDSTNAQEKKLEDQNSNDEMLEAVVGVFESGSDASRAASELKSDQLQVQQVSRGSSQTDDKMPELIYADVEEVDNTSIADGVMTGGAIGAGTGLLMLGVPLLNVAAPVAGALAGAFIGGVAGADEANRSSELPDLAHYRAALANGKSLVVLHGDQAARLEYANALKRFGATEVHQHPPVLHAVRSEESE